MNVKTTGAELKAFIDDDAFWDQGGGAWHEDTIYRVNGGNAYNDLDVDLLDDDDVVIIEGGHVFFEESEEALALTTFFRRWRRQQNTAHLAVSIDKERLEDLKEAIKAVGGRIH